MLPLFLVSSPTRLTPFQSATAQAFPSAGINSKRDIRRPRCLKPGQKACPLYSAAVGGFSSVLKGYDCVDIHNDLE